MAPPDRSAPSPSTERRALRAEPGRRRHRARGRRCQVGGPARRARVIVSGTCCSRKTRSAGKAGRSGRAVWRRAARPPAAVAAPRAARRNAGCRRLAEHGAVIDSRCLWWLAADARMSPRTTLRRACRTARWSSSPTRLAGRKPSERSDLVRPDGRGDPARTSRPQSPFVDICRHPVDRRLGTFAAVAREGRSRRRPRRSSRVLGLTHVAPAASATARKASRASPLAGLPLRSARLARRARNASIAAALSGSPARGTP